MSRPTEDLRKLIAERVASVAERDLVLGPENEAELSALLDAELDLTDAILRLSATADSAPDASAPRWLRLTDSEGRPWAVRASSVQAIGIGADGTRIHCTSDFAVVPDAFDDVLALVSGEGGRRDEPAADVIEGMDACVEEIQVGLALGLDYSPGGTEHDLVAAAREMRDRAERAEKELAEIKDAAGAVVCKALACTAPADPDGHGWCSAHLAYWGGDP